MCCPRKRKLSPPRAYFVLNLSAAGEFLSMQNDWNTGKQPGEVPQEICIQEQANAPNKFGFFILKYGYFGEGEAVI